MLEAIGFQVNMNGSMTEEKYVKRRQQKVEQRLKQSLMMLLAALLVLFYTWSSLSSSTSRKREVDDNLKTFRKAKYNHKSPFQKKKRKQSAQRGEDPYHIDSRHNDYPPPLQRQGLFDRFMGRDPNMRQYERELEELNEQVIHNINRGIRWVRSDLLPALNPSQEKPLLDIGLKDTRRAKSSPPRFLNVRRLAKGTRMEWEEEVEGVDLKRGPLVDYTKHTYEYPEKIYELPPLGEYPPLRPMKQLMEEWPQDEFDHPPTPFREALIHFDYTNPDDLKAAKLFRDAKLPFKVINVPEVVAAGEKWTDEYLSLHFDGNRDGKPPPIPMARGTCQESADNFFAFFAQGTWIVDKMGIPPTRNNDWTFEKWAQHARYADVMGLDPNQPHFYFQAGVDKEERLMDYSQWTFVSRDLPSLSSPTETFFVFEPESQKGIQCRFGERGVTAATHFDSGRNMVAMMNGAKRYVLSPPKECSKLGIVTGRGNPIFRHSMLNFGHLNEMRNTEMPEDERAWLERSGEAMVIDTVLKAGEVLYIPSHWFHYITSLQKSAQCNVRSGVDVEGDAYFGGKAEVTDKCEPF